MKNDTDLTTKPMISDAQSYLAAPYTRMLIPDPDEGGFIAEVLELPGCVSQGETPEEAIRNLEEAMTGYIGASLDHGKPIPPPVGLKEFSGHFPLRLSSELHREAAMRAMYEGVSLNQWIGQAIAERLAARSLASEVVASIRDSITMQMTSTIHVDVVRTTEIGKSTAFLRYESADEAPSLELRPGDLALLTEQGRSHANA